MEAASDRGRDQGHHKVMTILQLNPLLYCIVHRLQPDDPKQQVRIFMTGDAGLQVHAHSYFEVEDKRTGEVIASFVIA